MDGSCSSSGSGSGNSTGYSSRDAKDTGGEKQWQMVQWVRCQQQRWNGYRRVAALGAVGEIDQCRASNRR